MVDVSKSLENSEKIIEFLGLKITRRDRFTAIVVAATMVIAAGSTGYTLLEFAKADFNTKLEAARTEATNKVKTLQAASAARVDRLQTDVAALSDRIGDTNQWLTRLRDEMNGQKDGFWLPVPLKFGKPDSHVRFTLPIDPKDHVKMMVFGDALDRALLEDSIVIKVNTEKVPSPARFVAALTPQEVTGPWAEDGFQGFDVYLEESQAKDVFEKIRDGNISLLVVISRSYEGPNTENVPN